MMNQQQIKTNWPKIKAEVLSHWNKLSEAEVEKTHGSAMSLSKLVEDKYGLSKKARFNQEFEKICNTCVGPATKQDLSQRDQTTSDSAFAPRTGTPRVADSANDKSRNLERSHKPSFKGDNLDSDEDMQTAPDEFTNPQDPSRRNEEVKLSNKKSSLNSSSPQARDGKGKTI